MNTVMAFQYIFFIPCMKEIENECKYTRASWENSKVGRRLKTVLILPYLLSCYTRPRHSQENQLLPRYTKKFHY